MGKKTKVTNLTAIARRIDKAQKRAGAAKKAARKRKTAKKPSSRAHSAPADYKRPKPVTTAPPSKTWYAVVCDAGCEKKAIEALPRDLIRGYVPVTSQLRPATSRRRATVYERALFPRYFFVAGVKPGPFPFYALSGVPGVEKTVKIDGRPIAIPHAVIEELMKREDGGAFDGSRGSDEDRQLADLGLHKGDHVVVKDGPFATFVAQIKNLIGGKKAAVLLNIFGRETTITLDVASIGRVG